VPTVENVPGRRRAAAPSGPLALRERPASARAHLAGRRLAGDEQQPPPRTGPKGSAPLQLAWVLALLLVASGLSLVRLIEAPVLVHQSLATALGVLLAVGLAVRGGGTPTGPALLAAAVGVAAMVGQWPALLAGAAAATGVLAACLAVLATRPAATFLAAIGEVVLALLLATVGALGVASFSVSLEVQRFGYLVIGVALLATVVLVYRLAGGLHSLGRRGLVLAAGATVLLLVVLVYTAALTRYGSPELVLQVRSGQGWVLEHLGGVPHTVEALIGIPALVWGVSMRSRRRQGWWVCAFGATATAAVTHRLLLGDVFSLELVLAAAYTLVLGLVLGYVLIRLERLLTARPGRRTTLTALPTSGREEPGRLKPLH
jgi:hypothetical protein